MDGKLCSSVRFFQVEYDPEPNSRNWVKAYVPEFMVRREPNTNLYDLGSLELAFERITGVKMSCITLYEMTPNYILDEDLDFLESD